MTKVKKIQSSYNTDEDLDEKEEELIVKLSQFKKIVEESYQNLNPSIIAKYSFDLAQTFNEFYHACPVMGGEEKQGFRIALVESFAQVLKNSLNLLGINVLKEM